MIFVTRPLSVVSRLWLVMARQYRNRLRTTGAGPTAFYSMAFLNVSYILDVARVLQVSYSSGPIGKGVADEFS